jgi:hypothetical protein
MKEPYWYSDTVIYLTGGKFSPKEVEQALNIGFHSKFEIGDSDQIGKKKIIYDEGYAILKIPDSYSRDGYDDGFIWAVNVLAPIIHKLREYGVEEARVHEDIYYHSQCNFQFNPESMMPLFKMGVIITMSLHYIEDEDETHKRDEKKRTDAGSIQFI